jgi:glycosyltransferase involved in cell wall biosynthesis
MKIAIDTSPLESGHKVRGVGFYLKYLNDALVQYYPDYTYTFFTHKDQIPEKIDVIHYPYFDPFFLSLPIMKKHKTVVTVHDLTPLVFPEAFPAGIKGRIKWQIQKKALQQVDAVIADSESSKKDIIRLAGIPAEKIHVVYLAAGEEFSSTKHFTAKNELLKKHKLPESFALYVGDVTWNKNVPRIIEAAGEAGIPLVMVGKALTETEFDRSNPWNSDRIKIQDLTNDNKQVYRLGFLPGEELVGLYKAATVFVMPSLYEGFGLPVVEAMSSGCPVITAKAGSLSEVAGDGVYFVDPENTHAIANGFKKVFSDETLRKTLSQKGVMQAKKFSWKKAAGETAHVYETVYRTGKK